MCKVLMIAGIKKDKQEKVEKILKSASEAMSRIDDDGIGYAAITSKGNIYGEKWLRKQDAFVVHTQKKPEYSTLFLETLLDKALDWIKTPEPSAVVYGKFGDMTPKNVKDTVAVMLHARKATIGPKSIENTHPFHILGDDKLEDTALIHNGTIANHMDLTKKVSTCDSETLLHEYVKNNISYNPWGIEEFAKTVKGEYTVGVLSSAYFGETATPYLDIFKSNKELAVGYCPDIETAIFCTMPWILEEIARETGFRIENIAKIKDGFFIRIDAISGQRVDDLVKFDLSETKAGPTWGERQRGIGGQVSTTNENVSPLNKTQVTEDDIEETIEDVKKSFEYNHADLFVQKYHEPSGLTPQEVELLAELGKADTTDHKALRLVQKTLGIKISS